MILNKMNIYIYIYKSGCANSFVSIFVVREAKNEGGRGGRGGGRGYGRGRGGYNRDFNNIDSSFANTGAPAAQGASEDGDAGKSSERRGYGGPRAASGFRGGRHGGFANGEDGEGERPRRIHERRSGTGRGWVFLDDHIFFHYVLMHLS